MIKQQIDDTEKKICLLVILQKIWRRASETMAVVLTKARITSVIAPMAALVENVLLRRTPFGSRWNTFAFLVDFPIRATSQAKSTRACITTDGTPDKTKR